MGYDIVSAKTKKLKDESYNNVLSHIQCQYAYEPYFREAFGGKIQDWNGRLLKKDREEFIKGIDSFVSILENGVDVSMLRGNLSNCSQDTLIKEFNELKELILDGEIGYMSIS